MGAPPGRRFRRSNLSPHRCAVSAIWVKFLLFLYPGYALCSHSLRRVSGRMFKPVLLGTLYIIMGMSMLSATAVKSPPALSLFYCNTGNNQYSIRPYLLGVLGLFIVLAVLVPCLLLPVSVFPRHTLWLPQFFLGHRGRFSRGAADYDGIGLVLNMHINEFAKLLKVYPSSAKGVTTPDL